MLENLSNILESHPHNLWVAEVHSDPAEEADCGVETEGTRGSCVLHLSQERGGNDNVGTPA